MIIWSVIEKLHKEVKERFPNLPEDVQVAIVWKAYYEIEREVLMGPSEPVGILNMTEGYTYPLKKE